MKNVNERFLQSQILQRDYQDFLEDVEVRLIDEKQSSGPNKSEFYQMRTVRYLYPDGLSIDIHHNLLLSLLCTFIAVISIFLRAIVLQTDSTTECCLQDYRIQEYRCALCFYENVRLTQCYDTCPIHSITAFFLHFLSNCLYQDTSLVQPIKSNVLGVVFKARATTYIGII